MFCRVATSYFDPSLDDELFFLGKGETSLYRGGSDFLGSVRVSEGRVAKLSPCNRSQTVNVVSQLTSSFSTSPSRAAFSSSASLFRRDDMSSRESLLYSYRLININDWKFKFFAFYSVAILA
jgi:hypothetical protein